MNCPTDKDSRRSPPPLTAADLTEGDVNLSPRRQAYAAQHSATTRALLEEDARWFLHQSLSTPCLNALAACQGSTLTDLEGHSILDFHGNSVHQVGHGHPRVVQAVKDQLDRLPFCPRRYTNQPAVELARRLCQLSPVLRPLDGQGRSLQPRLLLSPSGTTAIGIALKLARYATGRFKTVSMWDSFHGASLDAISIGGEALFREQLGPLLPGCLHVPAYTPEGLGKSSADYVDLVLRKERDVAAVIAEPMRWTTVVSPPQEYWQQLRASCDRHGALLIIDEIPACLGRTGQLFCCQHFGIQPDILVIGKGLGGGLFPLAATIVRGDMNIAADRALGHYTHEKSPVGAAAALATLEVLEQEGLVERAAQLGRWTVNRLQHRLATCPLVHEIRGLGLQIAIELQDQDQPAREQADAILYHCLTRGLSFKVADGNVLTLSPPLTVQQEELETAIAILGEAIEAVH